MKLRIHDNSVRLRLNRREVAQFQETGLVRDSVQFGSGAELAFVLESSTAASEPRALFQGGTLRIVVPEPQGRHWAQSDEVGMEAPNAAPAILIEKDFQCMHRDENDPEAYPNPLFN